MNLARLVPLDQMESRARLESEDKMASLETLALSDHKEREVLKANWV